MTTPLFSLSEPAGAVADGDVDACLAPLQIALDWLSRIDEWHVRRSLRRAQKGLSDGVVPPLYASGIKYQPRPASRQEWLDVPAALNQGHAAAEDLAAWRAAELRAGGVDAEPVVGHEWISGTWRLKFAVRHPDGRIEDPAAIIGGRGVRDTSSAPGDTPLFRLSLPDTSDGSHFAPLQIALEGLTRINEWQLRRALRQVELGLSDTVIPPLYASGVVYKEEAPGREDWIDLLGVLRQRHADCEDLAAWRAAELRVAGYDVEPVIKWQWIPRELMLAQGYPAHKLPGHGVWMVHCCVRWPDGTIEDPSKILGMGGNFTERI